MSRYTVKAVFVTVQGEGVFTGTPAVFVRLVGCNMWSGYDADRARDAARTGAECPAWCDTDFTKEGATAYTADELVAAVCRAVQDTPGVEHVVFTGGEPLLQLRADVVQGLTSRGLRVAIETNGTVAMRDDLYALWLAERATPRGVREESSLFVTCSPKLAPASMRLQGADEIKVVEGPYLAHAVESAGRLGVDLGRRFVQPLDPTVAADASPFDAADVAHSTAATAASATRAARALATYRASVARAVAFIHAHAGWRLSTQTHKLNALP